MAALVSIFIISIAKKKTFRVLDLLTRLFKHEAIPSAYEGQGCSQAAPPWHVTDTNTFTE